MKDDKYKNMVDKIDENIRNLLKNEIIVLGTSYDDGIDFE